MTHWEAVWFSFALTILVLLWDFLLILRHSKQIKQSCLFGQLDSVSLSSLTSSSMPTSVPVSPSITSLSLNSPPPPTSLKGERT